LTSGQQEQGLSYLTKGFSRSVSAGIGSQRGALRFLGEEASKRSANPRGFRKVQTSGPGYRLFKASDGLGTILASLGVAFRFLTSLVRRIADFGRDLRSPARFFCSPCYPKVDLPVPALAAVGFNEQIFGVNEQILGQDQSD
jgi:hypothetical protein